MANKADGQIVLGLNIPTTTSNIQAGLDKILNNTKVRQIVIKTAIERTETEKSITALVNEINKKSIELGVEIDEADAKRVLAEQQKIASKQAELNRQMKEYRDIAKEIGITLGKDTWNKFNSVVATGDFSKANDILKSAKQQIDGYNKAVKNMNADTSVAGSVSSVVDKFSQLKNVSTETQKKIYLLKANLSQFEQADSTKAKLSSYRILQTLLGQLNTEYQQLSSTEKNLANTNAIQDKVKDAQTLYTSLSKMYSAADGQEGEALKSSLGELSTALDDFEKNSKGLSGGKLAAEWDKVDVAVQNVNRSVKEYKAEQSGTSKLSGDLDSVSKKISNALNSLGRSKASNEGITALKAGLNDLAQESEDVRKKLADLDPSNSSDVKKLRSEIDALISKYNELKLAEKASATDSSVKDKIANARSYLNVVKQTYSVVGDGKNAGALTSSISELNKVLDGIDANASGDALAMEWNKVDEAVQKVVHSVKEYKAEQAVTGKMELNIDSVSEGIDKAISSIDSTKATGAGVEKLKESLEGLKVRAQEIKGELANLDPSDGEEVSRLTNKINELRQEFSGFSGDIKVFGDFSNFAQFEKNVESARQKVAKYADTYSAIKSRPELVTELERLKRVASDISSPAQLKAFNAEFARFDTKVIQAGLHCESLADKLKRTFSNFAQFFSASHLMYRAVETIKDMTNNVKELDATMIELRKVTDETDATYEKFLSKTSKRAVELGTTITDLVKATSDYARLGYSIDEATKLGEIATIYANVGDDVNSIDDATSSLISTMKGFELETADALSIVDKLNEVGKSIAQQYGNILKESGYIG